MNQPALFFDDINHAFRDVITALGGAKKVGTDLWPEKDPDTALKYLSNCTDATRAEKLSAEQIIWLLKKGREADCHVAMHFICTECGYAPPQTREPLDEMAELQRDFIASVKMQQQQIKRLEKLTNGGSLQVVANG